MDRLRRRILLCGLAGGALPATWARAQGAYPGKTVRVSVPFGPGGATDIATRLTAERMSERFGQRFVVENQPGPGGIASARSVLGAPNDGYTVGVATNGSAISVSLFNQLPFDPLKDFEMISTMSLFEAVFVVPADSPYKTLQDFIKAARAEPGKLNVGTVTAGGTQHLAAELFKSDARSPFQIITYKTSPEVVVSLLRNDVQMAIEFYPAIRATLTDKKIVALATSGARRSATLPDIPTVQEGGVAGYDVTSWNGLYVPRGSPTEVIRILNVAVREAVSNPEVKRRFAELGLEARASTPKELEQRLRDDIAKWANVIAQSGIPKQ